VRTAALLVLAAHLLGAPQDGVERARQMRRAGELRGAIARLEQERRERPGDAEAAGLLGLCLLDAGEVARAHELASAPPPGADETFRWLVFRGRLALAAGRPGEALAPLETAVAMRARPIEALVTLVHAHAAASRYARALEVAERLETLAPSIGRELRADMLLAQADRMAHAGVEAIPLAIEKYQAVLELRPDDAVVKHKLLDVCVFAHRTDEALPLVEALYPIDVVPADHHYHLARVARAAADPAGARRHLEQALAIDPDHREARLELGRLLIESDELEAACDVLGPCVADAPDVARGHLLLGTAEEGLGRWEAAERSLRRAVELEPDNAKALYHLGRVLMRLGEREEGREVLERFRALDT